MGMETVPSLGIYAHVVTVMKMTVAMEFFDLDFCCSINWEEARRKVALLVLGREESDRGAPHDKTEWGWSHAGDVQIASKVYG